MLADDSPPDRDPKHQRQNDPNRESHAKGEGKRALRIAPADGGPERRLTDGSADDGLPRWTPDGRTVILTGEHQVYRLRLSDGTPHSVTS